MRGLLISLILLALLPAEARAEDPEPRVTLQLHLPATEGPVGIEDITKAFEAHVDELRVCYTLREGASPLGTVHVFFFVGPDGKVFKAEVATSSLGRPDVETCVKRQLVTWALPKPAIAESTTADMVIASSF